MLRSRRHAPLICHCEEAAGRRGNLGKAVTILPGLSCDPAGYCEIATGAKRPRNDKSLAFTVLTKACTGRKCSAGRGMPLPYNGVCGRRWCPEICRCPWRSLPVKGTPHPYGGRAANGCAVTAATDAIGLYVLSAAGTNRQCLPEIATGAKRPRNDNLGCIYHFNDSLYGRQVRRRARHASPLLFHTYRSGGQMSFSVEKTGRFSGKKFQKALAFRVFQCYNKDNL